jgi:hypothetical protein
MKFKVSPFKFWTVFLFLYVIFLFNKSSSCTAQDDFLQTKIVMDGIDVTEALDMGNAIVIDPNVGVIAKIEYLVTGNHSLEISYLKTIVMVADIDAASQTDNIDVTLFSGDNFTFVQKWRFDNFVGNENIALITGVYLLRYDLYYSIEGQENVIRGSPFYIEFNANPLTSVFGVISTISLAVSGISFVGLTNSLRGSLGLELESSLGETKVSPSDKLKGYYRGKSYSMAQAEVSNLLFGYASRLWRSDKCPQCDIDWPKNIDECPSCNISTEEAKKLFTNSHVKKTLNAIKEVVDSVSGLSLKGIADKIDEGVIPTTNIVSVITFSGLTIIKPRVSKGWSKKTRKLVFTGLTSSLYALFWVQACGFGVVSMATLIVALLSGFLIPIIISRILGNGLRAKISEFWQKEQLKIN